MNIYITNKDVWELIQAIIAIVTGLFIIIQQQEVANYICTILGA